jgi:hypothetical protein
MGGSTTCVEFFFDGATKIKKINEIFKMGKKIFSVFLDGATTAAVSGLTHFLKETALSIGPNSEPANADWLKKVKRFSQ